MTQIGGIFWAPVRRSSHPPCSCHQPHKYPLAMRSLSGKGFHVYGSSHCCVKDEIHKPSGRETGSLTARGAGSRSPFNFGSLVETPTCISTDILPKPLADQNPRLASKGRESHKRHRSAGRNFQCQIGKQAPSLSFVHATSYEFALASFFDTQLSV